MTIKDDFSDNENLASAQGEPLTVDTFEQYVEKYGPERAKGYLDALHQMTSELENLLYHKHGKLATPRSDAYIMREGRKILTRRYALIDSGVLRSLDNPTKDENILKP